jgi:hypothetical protein
MKNIIYSCDGSGCGKTNLVPGQMYVLQIQLNGHAPITIHLCSVCWQKVFDIIKMETKPNENNKTSN